MEDSTTSCRVIERRPAHGDIHPLSGKHLRRIIPGIYKRYFYGLVSVELLPRNGDAIGRPYGEYLNDERKIRLYSVPFPEWRFSGRTAVGLFDVHGAVVSREGDSTIVRWPSPLDLAYFMYREVFLHELGHHFHNRYRTKRHHPRTPAAKEASAERHAEWLGKLRAFQGWHDVEQAIRPSRA
jgi:hypothetical protein